MRTAIYCRRSNEERGKAEEAKSVTRQKESAREFAAKQGWTVVAEFVDDGISGAEFEKRSEFQAMLAAAERREFERLIVSERKSIGREQYETDYLVKRLDLMGVMIYEYTRGECLTPRSQHDKLKGSVDGYSDEAHIAKSSERMHEAHLKLPDRGLWPGGRVFGYRNKVIFRA